MRQWFKYIHEHLRKNFICSSLLAAAAPVLLVRKLSGGLHFCVDYCALNAIILKNWYPIPLINKTFGKLTNAVRFTKLNIIAAFNQMQIKESQKWLTVFNKRHGQFDYLVRSFDLYNAPETFQNCINNSLCEYLNVFCITYLDDMLVYSIKKKEHTGHMLDVLKWLWVSRIHVPLIRDLIWSDLILDTQAQATISSFC